MKPSYVICCALLGAIGLPLEITVAAPIDSPAVPTLINYQGYVTDASTSPSVPLGNDAPTNYDVEFRLYNSGTAGTVLWGEKQTVTIFKGQFSVLLGNGGFIDGSTPSGALDALFGPNGTTALAGDVGAVFLGLTVNAIGTTGAVEFQPRQQIVANPFSLRAKVADTALLADLAQSALAVVDGSLTGSAYAAGSVTGGGGGAIANGTIATINIANNAVNSAKIADNSISVADLANNSVGSEEIIDESITAADLNVNSVGGSEATFIVEPQTDRVRLVAPGSYSPYVEIRHDQSVLAFGIGSKTATLNYDGSGYLALRRDSADAGYARLNSSGGWSQSSDARLKEDVQLAESMLEKVLKIEPVYYRFKSANTEAKREFGVIAQNVDEQLPELVAKGDTWSVNYSGLGVAAIGAVQELHQMVQNQSAELEKLRQHNAHLEARLQRLEKVAGELAIGN